MTMPPRIRRSNTRWHFLLHGRVCRYGKQKRRFVCVQEIFRCFRRRYYQRLRFSRCRRIIRKQQQPFAAASAQIRAHDRAVAAIQSIPRQAFCRRRYPFGAAKIAIIANAACFSAIEDKAIAASIQMCRGNVIGQSRPEENDTVGLQAVPCQICQNLDCRLRRAIEGDSQFHRIAPGPFGWFLCSIIRRNTPVRVQKNHRRGCAPSAFLR